MNQLKKGSYGKDVAKLHDAINIQEVTDEKQNFQVGLTQQLIPTFGSNTEKWVRFFLNKPTVDNEGEIAIIELYSKDYHDFKAKYPNVTDSEYLSLKQFIPKIAFLEVDIDESKFNSPHVGIRNLYVNNVLKKEIAAAEADYNKLVQQSILRGLPVGVAKQFGNIKTQVKFTRSQLRKALGVKSGVLEKELVGASKTEGKVVKPSSKTKDDLNVGEKIEQQAQTNAGLYLFVGAALGVTVGFLTGASLTQTAIYGLGGGIVGYVITPKK